MRLIFAGCVLLTAALASGCGVSSVTAAAGTIPQRHASWATYQHSPDRNAVFAQYVLTRDWTYHARAKIDSGLALVGNTLLFTTFDHSVIAIDVRDGHELWRAHVPNAVMSTPIVAGNTVYIGTGIDSALDRSIRSRFSWRNLLLKLRYGNKPLWGIPAGDEIAAFDVHTGAPRWTHRTIGEDMPSAVYDKGRLIFASGDWHAYALRADTGQQLWSTDLGGVSTTASAVMAGNAVVVGVRVKHHTEYAAIALDPASGRILWRSPYGHSDASPAYAGGKVFLASSTSPIGSLRPKMTVAAVDAVTGRAIWVHREAPTGLWSAVGSQASAIAGTYAHGTYYQPAPLTDQIIAFDASSGKVRWRFHTAGPVKMSPVVSNGRLYAGDTVGLLYTLDARNGKLLELRAFRAGFTTSPPIIAGNKLIVADGTTVDMLPLSGVHADPRYYDDDTALRGRK